mmetsp:Transcript_106916/g.330289  ORF Transcript_106916/g.330289 Transcript_106916/m.330289 type:complete len:300 (-) Transcript_106916:1881-2780(-)
MLRTPGGDLCLPSGRVGHCVRPLGRPRWCSGPGPRPAQAGGAGGVRGSHGPATHGLFAGAACRRHCAAAVGAAVGRGGGSREARAGDGAAERGRGPLAPCHPRRHQPPLPAGALLAAGSGRDVGGGAGRGRGRTGSRDGIVRPPRAPGHGQPGAGRAVALAPRRLLLLAPVRGPHAGEGRPAAPQHAGPRDGPEHHGGQAPREPVLAGAVRRRGRCSAACGAAPGCGFSARVGQRPGWAATAGRAGSTQGVPLRAGPEWVHEWGAHPPCGGGPATLPAQPAPGLPLQRHRLRKPHGAAV